MILVYTFGYPPTIVVVMTSLISGNCFNRSLLEPEDKVDFTSYEREKAVIISVFTIFMNSVPLCLNFISTTTRKIAIFATCLQIVGLLLCYLTISNSRIGIILGFGVLVSGGIGLNIVNNITVACRVFPNTLTLACGNFSYIINLFEEKSYTFNNEITTPPLHPLVLLVGGNSERLCYIPKLYVFNSNTKIQFQYFPFTG